MHIKLSTEHEPGARKTMRCPTFLKASLAVGLALVSGFGVQTAQAQSWAPMATVSGTATLVTNSLCYTDGLDIVCNGTGPAAAGASTDRITSSTTAAVIANQTGGTVSFTLGGTAGAAYFHPSMGLVTSGVSTTGNISASTLLSSGRATFKGGLLFNQGPTGMDNLIYAGGTSAGAVNASLGFFVAGVGSSTASQGPYFLGRGNTYNDLGNQRGSMLFVAGNPTTPSYLEGAIQFWSGNEVRRMIVEPTGNIGIATTAAAAATLDVSGSIKISADGATACSTATAGAIKYTSPTFYTCNGTGGWQALGSGGGGTSDRIISGTTGIYTYNNTSASIATAGVERLVVGTTGNVGIGQQPTNRALSVSGSAIFSANYPGGNGPHISLIYTPGTTPGTFGPYLLISNSVPNMHGFILTQNQDVSSSFAISNPSSPFTNYFNITQAGKVGILDTDPKETFSIGRGFNFHTGGNIIQYLNTYYDGQTRFRGYAGGQEYGGRIDFAPTTGTILLAVTSNTGVEGDVATWNNGLSIKSNGVGIGIGVATPSSSLQIGSGEIQTSTSGNSCVTTNAGAIRYTGGNLSFCNGTTWNTLTSSGGTVQDRIVSGTTGVYTYNNTSASIATAGVERVVIGTTGNIGIASQPASNIGLTISGSTNVTKRLFVGAVPDQVASSPSAIYVESGEIWVANNPYRSWIGSGTANSKRGFRQWVDGAEFMALYSNNVGDTIFENLGTERMRITSAGNLGIGTSAPGAPLTVATGTGQFTDAISVLPSTHATSRRAAINLGDWKWLQDSYGNGIKDFSLYQYTGGVSYTRIFVDENGKVGIGNASPSETLHVGGIATGGRMFVGEDGPNRRGLLIAAATNAELSATIPYARLSAFNYGNMLEIPLALNPFNQAGVGIGTNAPSTTLHTIGSIRIGAEASTTLNTCNANRTGAIRYSGGDFAYCRNGTAWESLTSLTGGGGSASDRIVSGTTGVYAYNNTSASIITAGVERVVIGANGKIGIGQQPDPSYGIFISSSTPYMGFRNGTATGYIGSIPGGFLMGATSDNSVSLIANNAVRMTINNDGRVGIGTTTPQGYLDVSGTIVMRGTPSGYGYFQPKYGTDPFDAVNYDRYEVQLDPNNPTTFIGNESGGTGVPRNLLLHAGGVPTTRSFLYLTSNTRAGINTTDPSTTLHVAGSIRLANGAETCDANRTGAIRYSSGDFFYCRNGSSWESLTSLTGGGGSASDRIVSGTTGVYTYNGTSASIATAGVERVVIGTTGNVGIGSQPTTASLFVSGTINSTNSYIARTTTAIPLAVSVSNSTGLMSIGVASGAGHFSSLAQSGDAILRNTNTSGSNSLIIANETTGDIMLSTGVTDTEKMRITNAGNVGIGTTIPDNKLEIYAGNLGTIAGNIVSSTRIRTLNSNNDYLNTTSRRLVNGTTWSSAATRIQRQIDTIPMGYIQFGSYSAGQDLLTFGENETEYMRIDGSGNVGIGLTNPNTALAVAGTVSATGLYVGGDITYTGNIYGTSDRRLKTDITPLGSSLEVLNRLRPVSYQFSNKLGHTEYGFIAQEVQKLYPTLIGKAGGTSGTLTLNYMGLIAPMVRSIQEVDTRVNKLETENAALRTELDTLRAEVRALAKQRTR